MTEAGVRADLPAHPASVGQARRLVRGELERHGRDDLVDSGTLLVSELVTNALVHVGAGIEVCALVDDRGLHVEVADASPTPPAARHHAATAGTGRGLALLGQLAQAWGSTPRGAGKVVWFDLATDEPTDGAGSFEGPTETAAAPVITPSLDGLPEVVEVVLLEMPLLLHTAWQQHVAALLRDSLLVSLGTDAETDALWSHALNSQARSLLATHVPEPEIGLDADELIATAVEPLVTAARVVVPVPAEAVTYFDNLERRR